MEIGNLVSVGPAAAYPASGIDIGHTDALAAAEDVTLSTRTLDQLLILTDQILGTLTGMWYYAAFGNVAGATVGLLFLLLSTASATHNFLLLLALALVLGALIVAILSANAKF